MAIHWNAAYTSRLRKFNDSAWGTITLASDVPLGAYGIFDSNKEFHQYGVLDLTADTTFTAVGDYSGSDAGVKTVEQGMQVSGQFRDPDTGTDVSVGIEWEWSFAKEQSFLMQTPRVYSTRYENVTQVLQSAEAQLVETAAQYGWTRSDGTVKEGWCLIVELLQIASGFITGSNSANSTFAIRGAADAVNRLMDGEANAAYSAATTSNQNDMFTFLWPESPYLDGDGGNVASLTALRTIGVVPATYNHQQLVYPYAG